jgi:glutathione peroxidase-family protein
VTRLAAALALSSVGLGCGTNAPEIPDELLGSSSTCSAPGYPQDGYGAEEGDVVQNACFLGYRSPAVVKPDSDHVETIAFSDYYDPAGTKGQQLLLVNTAAVWCSACIAEHHVLPGHFEELRDEGLVILGALFQDAQRNPASLDDVERWIENFDTNFPMVADPEIQMAIYASPTTAPLNLVVDSRTMKILRKYIGDQATVMWPFIESELARRNAAR